MKIALIGYGAMGRLIETTAKNGGDEIGVVIASADRSITAATLSEKLRGCAVAIDFSVAEAVQRNVEACVTAGIPIVVGTTGWKDHEAEVKSLVSNNDGAMVYGANFSIGVNVFYRIVSNAAKLFSKVDNYAAFIEEAHHSRKRDAPSGTALKLRDLMFEQMQVEIPTSSTRAGFIPGTHRVGFDSEADTITLTHTARSRQGFASGALLAAKWVIGHKGIYEFGKVVEEILSKD
jgi:4-hydroxy-tetrahydrodipicolinate reductase